MRSMRSGARCCSSSAKALSTRTISAAGSGRASGSGRPRRGHSSLTGRENAASRSPAISGQAVITSDAAKPCARSAGPRQLSMKSARGFGRAIVSFWRKPSAALDRRRRLAIEAHASGFASRLKARSGRASRLVRPPPPRPALARQGRRAGRPPSGLAVRDHAAADDGCGREALLRALPAALPDGRKARRGAGRAGDAGLGRARLLLARPQPPCLRQGRRRAPRRALPRHRGRLAPPARHRRLHGGGDRGDFAQALMDLGATICTPKRPACAICPWLGACRARAAGVQETLPRKAPKAEGVLRRGAAFVALRGDDCVLLRTRPPSCLLGGMDEVPTSEWSPDYDASKALRDAPLEAGLRRLPGLVRHTFTHFPLELTVLVATVAAGTPAPAGMRFASRRALAGAALPGVMRKVLAHADVAPAGPAPRRE